jgi:hypothetical protein
VSNPLRLTRPALRLPISTYTRRLALAVTALALLAAALLGPSQTLALTHKASCSASSARVAAKHGAHACVRAGRKHKHRHASRHAGAKALAGAPAPAASSPAATCADGSAPVRAGNGSFACDDGSEPECESGATPTRSGNGKRLLCPSLNGDETEPGEEAECEEGFSLTCSDGTSPAPSEHGCEEAADSGSSFACEAEG